MSMHPGTRRLAAVAVIPGLLLAGTAGAGTAIEAPERTWRFSLAPYLWVPRIDGTLNFTPPSGQGGEFEVSVKPGDYLEHLNAPFMFGASASRGAWTFATDFMYVDFSGEQATVTSIRGPAGAVEFPVDAGSTIGLRGTLWSLGAGYRAVRGAGATLEVLGGFRYFSVQTSLDWHLTAGTGLASRSGSDSQTDHLWDGILAVRGEVRPGTGRWLVPYYVDAGAGSATVTWSGTVGLAYEFGWGDVRVTYHHVQYDADEALPVERLVLTGPVLGANLRF